MPKIVDQVSADQIKELRCTSDREMHRRYGISANTWRRVRDKHSIPRHRPATTLGGVPQKWAAPVVRDKSEARRWENPWNPQQSPFSIPPRDHSLAGEAAAFLQRERFYVFDRAKVGQGEGWQVGRSVLSVADMIAKATRLGFRREAWMGGL